MTRAQVKCLVRVSDWAVKSGNLTGLLITGLTPRGGELIENYVKQQQTTERIITKLFEQQRA